MSIALEDLIERAKARFAALSPEEQEAELRAQRQSWVRGEMAIGLDRAEAATRREHRLDISARRAVEGVDPRPRYSFEVTCNTILLIGVALAIVGIALLVTYLRAHGVIL
jgi:hypothetical protein